MMRVVPVSLLYKYGALVRPCLLSHCSSPVRLSRHASVRERVPPDHLHRLSDPFLPRRDAPSLSTSYAHSSPWAHGRIDCGYFGDLEFDTLVVG